DSPDHKKKFVFIFICFSVHTFYKKKKLLSLSTGKAEIGDRTRSQKKKRKKERRKKKMRKKIVIMKEKNNDKKRMMKKRKIEKRENRKEKEKKKKMKKEREKRKKIIILKTTAVNNKQRVQIHQTHILLIFILPLCVFPFFLSRFIVTKACNVVQAALNAEYEQNGTLAKILGYNKNKGEAIAN
ncbi:hypothetical protein RFI_01605, partial [Reticulomyxa filosa]